MSVPQVSRRYTAADVIYDPVSHTSTLPDGQPVPHVTAVLAAVGVSTDFQALAAQHPRMAQRITAAGDRGTAVHADCHAYDDNDLVWDLVDPRVLPYVEAWAAFRAATHIVPCAHGRERRVYHPLYNYAGILDGVFMLDSVRTEMFGERRVLVDIKTGNPEDAAAHLQTAAYASAWEDEHPDQLIDERWSVWLRPDLSVPYRIVHYTAMSQTIRHAYDFHKFTACLTVYWEQPSRRPKRRH